MEIIVPEGWEDVTVNQYQELRELKREEYSSDLSYMNEVLQVLCDIPTAESFTMDNVANIAPHISFINKTPLAKKKRAFKYKGNSYKWIGGFDALTLGEVVSIEQIIDLEALTFDQSLDVVLAVLLRKDEEAFNVNDFQKNREFYGSIPVTEVIGMLLFFFNGGKMSIRNSATYSIVTARTKRVIQKRSSKLKRLLLRVIQTVKRSSGYQWLTSFLKATRQKMYILMI